MIKSANFFLHSRRVPSRLKMEYAIECALPFGADRVNLRYGLYMK